MNRDVNAENINASAGTLTDEKIKEFCRRHRLIAENYAEENVKQCCYELRAGSVYYDLSNPESPKIEEVGEGGYILIKPRQNVVILTEEVLHIEDDFLGRILSKGKLFSIGILPVNTYADPGFYGKMGIVFHNSSQHYIKIKPLEAIAKIEFSKLSDSVRLPYHGQHGYQTGVWPVPASMLLNREEIRSDSRIGDVGKELERSYGTDVSTIYHRLVFIERRLVISMVVYFVAMLAYIAYIADITNIELDIAISIGVGVVSNIVFLLITYFCTNFRKGK